MHIDLNRILYYLLLQPPAYGYPRPPPPGNGYPQPTQPPVTPRYPYNHPPHGTPQQVHVQTLFTKAACNIQLT